MLKEKGFHSSLVLNFFPIFALKEFLIIETNCPGGGIGRHKGLKIPRRQLRAGSSPALGTILKQNFYVSRPFHDQSIGSGKAISCSG